MIAVAITAWVAVSLVAVILTRMGKITRGELVLFLAVFTIVDGLAQVALFTSGIG